MRDGRILYQVGTHEVGAYEYHRWVETPDRVVQDSLVRLLRASGKFQSVDTPRNPAKPDYIVQGQIYEFSEIVPTENSISCSIFSIHKSKNVSWNVRRIIGSTFTELRNDLVEHCLVQS